MPPPHPSNTPTAAFKMVSSTDVCVSLYPLWIPSLLSSNLITIDLHMLRSHSLLHSFLHILGISAFITLSLFSLFLISCIPPILSYFSRFVFFCLHLFGLISVFIPLASPFRSVLVFSLQLIFYDFFFCLLLLVVPLSRLLPFLPSPSSSLPSCSVSLFPFPPTSLQDLRYLGQISPSPRYRLPILPLHPSLPPSSVP